MSKAEEFLREHGHITEMTRNYPHRTEKSYIISDKTLHELMRVFAEQYAAEVSRERAVEFMFDSLGYNDHPNSNEYPRIKAHLRKRFDNWIKEQEGV